MRPSGTTRPFTCLAALVLALAAGSPTLRAADDPSVARGVQFLKSQAAGLGYGEMALATLGLLKADVPTSDPVVSACLSQIRQRFSSAGFDPQEDGGKDVYVAAVVALVLANL